MMRQHCIDEMTCRQFNDCVNFLITTPKLVDKSLKCRHDYSPDLYGADILTRVVEIPGKAHSVQVFVEMQWLSQSPLTWSRVIDKVNRDDLIDPLALPKEIAAWFIKRLRKMPWYQSQFESVKV